MKKISTILLLGSIFTSGWLQAQDIRDRVITTAVPFLLVAADARAAGMGDQGVATSADLAPLIGEYSLFKANMNTDLAISGDVMHPN